MIDGLDEYFSFYQHQVKKARKAHSCDECRRTIQPGERYTRSVGLDGGTWSIYKTCSHCGVAQEWLRQECGGFIHTMVLEDLEEHFENEFYSQPGKKFGLGRLIVGMRRDWLRVRRDSTGKPMLTPALMPLVKLAPTPAQAAS